MTEADKPIIRIFHNLARSGGTIVGKCLGSMKDVYDVIRAAFEPCRIALVRHPEKNLLSD